MLTAKSTPQSSTCQLVPIDLRYLSDDETPSGPRGIAHRLSPLAALIGLVYVELTLLTWSCRAGGGPLTRTSGAICPTSSAPSSR